MNAYRKSLSSLGIVGVLVFLLAFIPMLVGMALLRGFTLSCLYMWFIYTRFVGLPALGTFQFVGIGMFVSMLWWNQNTAKPQTDEEKEESETTSGRIWAILEALFVNLFVLGCGYAWHHYVG